MRCGATAGCWARPSPAPAACWPAHSRPWPDPVTGSSAASSRTATRPRSTSWTCRPTRSIISARSANRWRWKWPPACCWRRRPRTWRCRPPASPDRAAPRRSKPVGMVCFGFAMRNGDGISSRAVTHVFPGDRAQVRQAAVEYALRGLLEFVGAPVNRRDAPADGPAWMQQGCHGSPFSAVATRPRCRQPVRVGGRRPWGASCQRTALIASRRPLAAAPAASRQSSPPLA